MAAAAPERRSHRSLHALHTSVLVVHGAMAFPRRDEARSVQLRAFGATLEALTRSGARADAGRPRLLAPGDNTSGGGDGTGGRLSATIPWLAGRRAWPAWLRPSSARAHLLAGPGCSQLAPSSEGNGDDRAAAGFFRVAQVAAGGGGGGTVSAGGSLDYSRSPGSPLECAAPPPPLRFPGQQAFAASDNFPTITTTTADPDNHQHRSPHRGSPVAGRASLKRKASVPEALAPSPPTLAASTMTDLITRGIDKFVELEHKRMRLELDLLERLRHEEMERVERMRREEMEHELRLMTVIASLFNNNNSASSVNLNSSSSTSAGTQPPSGDTS